MIFYKIFFFSTRRKKRFYILWQDLLIRNFKINLKQFIHYNKGKYLLFKMNIFKVFFCNVVSKLTVTKRLLIKNYMRKFLNIPKCIFFFKTINTVLYKSQKYLNKISHTLWNFYSKRNKWLSMSSIKKYNYGIQTRNVLKYKCVNKYLYSYGFLKLQTVISRLLKKGYVRAAAVGFKHTLNLYKSTQYVVKYKSIIYKYRYNKSIVMKFINFVLLHLIYILFVRKKILI